MSLRIRTPSRTSGLSIERLGKAPFLVPAAVPYLLFVIYPIFYVIVLSNYVTLLTKDPIFWVALKSSLTWTVLSLTIPTTLGLGLALVLNQRFRGRTFFRALYYVPAVLGSISV